MTIQQLIDRLKQEDSNATVAVTWEGIIRHIDDDSIYRTPKGLVLIDADDNFYKEDWQSGEIDEGDR